ncbi:MAG: phage capsid protein [Eubacterium sp.]
MAVTNFKPTLWEGALISNFHNVSIGDVISTRPTKIEGSKVIFNRIGGGNVRDYAGSIAWDEITTTPVEMMFDQKKYFAFSLDDCDACQLAGPVMNETTAEHAALLAEKYDTHVLTTLANGVVAKNSIGTVTDKKTITPKNAYDYMVDLGTVLSKAKAPKANRYVVVNAEMIGVLSKDSRFTNNPAVLVNGIVEGQVINTLQVVQSEELPANKIVALYKGAIGAAKQLDEVEAMRLQDSFSDGIRGLCQYGAKVLRDDAIAVLHCTIGTQADIPATKVEVTNTVGNPVNTKVTP